MSIKNSLPSAVSKTKSSSELNSNSDHFVWAVTPSMILSSFQIVRPENTYIQSLVIPTECIKQENLILWSFLPNQ